MNRSQIKPVIILGAGPVGLGASVELARCHVPSILIERNATTSWHPKTRNFNTRTMEIARGWGREVYDELRQLDLPIQWKSPIRFFDHICGRETGNLESKGFKGAGPECSPVSSVLSSQDMIEPVMLQQAQRSGMVDVRFNTEMLEFISGHEDDAEGVRIRIRNKETGEESIIEGSALIAADGAASSMRERLELKLEGTLKIAHFINTYFKADLEKHVGDKAGILLFVASEKASGVFQPLDSRGRWLAQMSVPEDQWSTDLFTKERCAQWIRDASGVEDLEIEVVSVGKWQMNAAVCHTLQKGRVLMMGDAAHMFPPTGGLGVNTGLQGMHNAIWKLALFLRGKAGRGLLQTYTTERKPVSKWVAEQSFHNASQVGQMRALAMGQAAPSMTAEQVLTATRRYGNQLGMELGSIYSSPAVVADGTDVPQIADPYVDYVPCGRPGSRAPHVWLLSAGQRYSTLDLLSPEFTLLVAEKGQGWGALVAQLSSRFSLDIRVHQVGIDSQDEEKTFNSRYGLSEQGAVLIRPDGYIAWRGQQDAASEGAALEAALKQVLDR